MREAGAALGLLVIAALGPGIVLPRPVLAASTAHVTVAVTPRTLPADGTSRGSVKAVVTDASGAPFANQAVTFTTTGNETLVPAVATTGSDGSAAVTVVASTAAGAYPITATLVDGTTAAPRATATLYDGPGWSLWNPPTSAAPSTAAVPPGRVDPSMAYDAVRHNVVLFGGRGNWLTRTGLLSTAAGFDDTWTWDGTSWTQRQPATHPPPGDLAAMAYDPGTGKVVRFGGQAFPVTAGQSVVMPNPGYVTVVNDTWTWDGTTWTKEATPPALTARTDASLAWDGHGLVLFGGSGCYDADPTTSLCSDTWRWGPAAGGGTGWTRLLPPVSPAGRQGAAMVYDQASGTDLLFSGDAGQGAALNDTWSWNGSTGIWAQLHPSTSPSSRFRALAAYDSDTRSVVLSGGVLPDNTQAADTWTWNGTTWAQQSPGTSPAGTPFPSFADGAAAFDEVNRTMVVLGPGQPVIPSPLSGLTPLLSQTWTYLDASATTLTLTPPVIAANGVATTTATAAVVGVDGTPSTPAGGESVAFGTGPGGDVTFGPVSNVPAGRGTYVTTITASRTADAETITAVPVLATVGGSALLVETGYGAALTPAGGVAFGNQSVGTTTAPQTVTLSNTSTFPLAITGISSSLADFTLTSGCPSSPATLASGASCPIAVAFTPSRSGLRSGTLSVVDNAAGSPQSVGLTGTGVAALSGDASALHVEGMTLLGGTAAQHLPDGGQGVCEAGPLTAAGASVSTGSGLPGCQASGQLPPLMKATAATETVSTGSGGARAHSNVASLSLLPGMGLAGADVLDVSGLDAQSSTSCSGGSGTATGSSSIAGALLINGTKIATQPLGSRIIFNPTGRNPITLYGTPVTVNPAGSRVPMAIVTLNYSRHDPATNTQVTSPLEVEFPAGGALSPVIVGRVFLSYATSGAQGCQ